MPAISLIVTTYRLGGLDVLFDSLAKQSFTNFELVLVDALYDTRTKIVMREARDRFLHVQHVRLNPHPFPAYAPASERNAGIVASTGDAILFLDDYVRLAPDFVERHAQFHDKTDVNRVLQGTVRVHALDTRVRRFNFDEKDMAAFQAAILPGASPSVAPYLFAAYPMGEELGLPPDPLRAGGRRRLEAKEARLFNLSCKRQLVVEVDGFKTEHDRVGPRGAAYFGVDFIERLAARGAQLFLDPELVADAMMPIGDEGHHPQRILQRAPTQTIAEAVERGEDLTLRPPSGDTVKVTHRKKLRVAMVYGAFSSAIHGPFDLDGLYDRVGLTGSESSFFNLAGALARRGHEVVVFCECAGEYDHPSGWKAMPLHSIQAFPQVEGVDAMIAWNEPDYLRFAPAGARRYCDQQLNDFGYCREPRWRELVDVWVSPSENHKAHVMRKEHVPMERCVVIPNSVDRSLLASPQPARHPHRVVWCSSPDRGLHHLLAVWPSVRQRVPSAELRIFYRLAPWIEMARDLPDEVGHRARYIEAALERLREGWGVTVLDSVPNRRMMRELQEAGVLAYPCDPVRYTEGFGVSVLDACAAGCIPIVSSADALPEVHVESGAALCIPGPIDHGIWGAAIADRLTSPRDEHQVADMLRHAGAHDIEAIADRWEKILP